MRSNALTELPAWLGEVASLRKLYASSNQLSRLPPELGRLRLLEELDVRGNALTELPAWLGEVASLRKLDASNNPLQLPPAAVAARGVDAVRRFFADLFRQGSSVSRRVKLVLVGAGLAGKSSALRGLLHRAPRPTRRDERTVRVRLRSPRPPHPHVASRRAIPFFHPPPRARIARHHRRAARATRATCRRPPRSPPWADPARHLDAAARARRAARRRVGVGLWRPARVRGCAAAQLEPRTPAPRH